MTQDISCAFDSGAIEVVSSGNADHAAEFALRIRQDTRTEFRQWFHFRVSGARGVACTLRFENAGACTYPKGWTDYRAVASYDRSRWFRVPTRYDGAVMTVEHTPERDAVWYAYFEPYSLERHQALIHHPNGEHAAVEPQPELVVEPAERARLGRFALLGDQAEEAERLVLVAAPEVLEAVPRRRLARPQRDDIP